MSTLKADEEHRFGFYQFVSATSGAFSVAKARLPFSVVEELTAATSVLFELLPVAIALRAVELNYADTLTWRDQHIGALSSAGSVSLRGGVLPEAQAAGNQHIGNFLASASAMLDNSSRRLRRLHGASSQAFKRWDAKRQKLHDAHFAYRFLFQLRHFAQHRTLPISALTVKGVASPDGSTMAFDTVVTMSRDALLEEGFDWKHAAKELRAQPPEFDLAALLPTYLSCLQQLFLAALEPSVDELERCDAHLQKLIDDNEPLRDMMRAQGLMDAMAAIFTGPEPTPDVHPPKLTLIPTQQLEWLTGLRARLRNECAETLSPSAGLS